VSDTIKIEIEIPAPPEGWGEVEYRKALPGDYRLDCGIWFLCDCATDAPYPVARKLTPLWTPPLELVEVLGHGWLTRDRSDVVEWHLTIKRPCKGDGHWHGDGLEVPIAFVRPSMLPPSDIPWEQCCFKIGEPQE
jgi:hypothetical protein